MWMKVVENIHFNNISHVNSFPPRALGAYRPQGDKESCWTSLSCSLRLFIFELFFSFVFYINVFGKYFKEIYHENCLESYVPCQQLSQIRSARWELTHSILISFSFSHDNVNIALYSMMDHICSNTIAKKYNGALQSGVLIHKEWGGSVNFCFSKYRL